MSDQTPQIGIMRVPVGPGHRVAGRDDRHVMGWLFFVSSLFWPRLFILGFWIFGSQLGRAFSSWVIPAIGFLVAPWTTVGYAFMWSISSDKVSGWEWIVVAGCVLLDLATYAGGHRLIRGR